MNNKTVDPQSITLTISAENRAWLDAFAQFLGTQAKKTREAYVRDTERLAAATHPVSLASLTRAQIARQMAQWHAQGLSGRSLARMLSSWRAFYRFLLAQPQTPLRDDPCAHLKAPRSARRLPSVLGIDEAQQLLNHHDVENGVMNVRNVALFELAYSSGLRVAELTGLNVGDVDLLQHEARVLGKGDKERIVPVGRYAVVALEQWLPMRTKILEQHAHGDEKTLSEKALFINQRGRRLSTRSVQNFLHDLSVAKGLVKNVHPHMLRHSFASHFLESSGDLRAVQELLGHASIASTQVYAHLDYQALAKVYDAAHPRARKRKE